MSMPGRSGAQVRIGVAVAVPEPYSSELAAARERFGDPQAGAIPPHVTVLPPTVVEHDDMAAVVEHLEKAVASCERFEVALRGPGTFRPVSPVVFARLERGREGCAQVESAVRSGLLDVPLRFDYHPHVTVAHEVSDACLDRAFDEMQGYEATFEVRSVHLFEHGDDGVWRAVAEFFLGDDEPL